MAQIYLSLVLPAYKQEKTISEDIKNLDKALKMLGVSYEIIVVVDGFLDKTYEIAKKEESHFAKASRDRQRSKNSTSPRLRGTGKDQESTISNQQSGIIRVFGYKENEGKGFAIKHGVEKAKGEIIGFIDAGMDLAPTELPLMLNIMEWNSADIVIGSKLHPDSKVNYPRSRKILSWGYRSIVKVLFHLNIKDSQVGIKIFRRQVAKTVFPKIVVKKFAFDIEVLAVAQSLGFTKIYEAPVKLKFRPGSISTVNFWKVSFWTLWDTLAVFYRMHILHFYEKES